jgi:hypothetical protein
LSHDEHGDDGGGWDDPDEATRRLQSVDLAGVTAPARPLEMEWDDDELTTHMWNQLHMPAPSQRANPPAASRRAQIAEQARDAAAKRGTLAKTRTSARKDSTLQLRAQARQPTAAPRRAEAQEGRPEWAQDLRAYEPPAPSRPPAHARAPRSQAVIAQQPAASPRTLAGGKPVKSRSPLTLEYGSPIAQPSSAPAAAQRALPRTSTRAYEWQPEPQPPRPAARTKTQTFHPATAQPQQPPAPRHASGFIQPTLYQAPALPKPSAPARRAPQLRILPSEPVATSSAFEAELATQSTRALWVRSVAPGLALFAAVFVARVLMFEGAAPEAPAASSPPLAAPPVPAPAYVAPVVEDASPVAPTTRPSSAPARNASARRSQLMAAEDADEPVSAPTTSRSTERRGSTRRATSDVADGERVTRDEPAPAPTRSEPTATEPSSPAPAAARSRDVAAAGSGMLRINSRPWSKVFVDGTLIGTTPQMAITLSPGQHTIELVNPDLEMSKTVLVDIEPNQLLTKVVNLIE